MSHLNGREAFEMLIEASKFRKKTDTNGTVGLPPHDGSDSQLLLSLPPSAANTSNNKHRNNNVINSSDDDDDDDATTTYDGSTTTENDDSSRSNSSASTMDYDDDDDDDILLLGTNAKNNNGNAKPAASSAAKPSSSSSPTKLQNNKFPVIEVVDGTPDVRMTKRRGVATTTNNITAATTSSASPSVVYLLSSPRRNNNNNNNNNDAMMISPSSSPLRTRPSYLQHAAVTNVDDDDVDLLLASQRDSGAPGSSSSSRHAFAKPQQQPQQQSYKLNNNSNNNNTTIQRGNFTLHVRSFPTGWRSWNNRKARERGADLLQDAFLCRLVTDDRLFEAFEPFMSRKFERTVENRLLESTTTTTSRSSHHQQNQKHLIELSEVRPVALPSSSTITTTTTTCSDPLAYSASTGLTLRPYQIEGVNFMLRNFCHGISTLLADDMGLGKTAQTCVFLRTLKDRIGLAGPHLIVCPLSTVSSWLRELQRWAPNLSVINYRGSQKHRTELQQRGPRVFVVTPATFASDKKFFLSIMFGVAVIDEAHVLKNDNTHINTVTGRIHTCGRLGLTGTPVSNTASELWSLTSFLFPTMRKGVARPDDDDDDAARDAVAFLRHVMLRRTKKDILKDLPEKVIHPPTLVDPAPVQALALEKILSRAPEVPQKMIRNFVFQCLKLNNHPLLFGVLASKGGGDSSSSMVASSAISATEALSRSRRAIQSIQEKNFDVTPGLENFISSGADLNEGEVIRSSAKMLQLDALLKNILVEDEEERRRRRREQQQKEKQDAAAALQPQVQNHLHCQSRVLIFSRFATQLDILEAYCVLRGFLYERLDGSTLSAERELSMARFNHPTSKRFLYLITTTAGGVGITLTGANHVVFYDTTYNPQVDRQAADRAHRIGQTRTVHVHRLCVAGSIEENVLERAAAKARLGDFIVDGIKSGGGSAKKKNKNKNKKKKGYGDDDDSSSSDGDDKDGDDDDDEDVKITKPPQQEQDDDDANSGGNNNSAQNTDTLKKMTAKDLKGIMQHMLQTQRVKKVERGESAATTGEGQDVNNNNIAVPTQLDHLGQRTASTVLLSPPLRRGRHDDDDDDDENNHGDHQKTDQNNNGNVMMMMVSVKNNVDAASNNLNSALLDDEDEDDGDDDDVSATPVLKIKRPSSTLLRHKNKPLAQQQEQQQEEKQQQQQKPTEAMMNSKKKNNNNNNNNVKPVVQYVDRDDAMAEMLVKRIFEIVGAKTASSTGEEGECYYSLSVVQQQQQQQQQQQNNKDMSINNSIAKKKNNNSDAQPQQKHGEASVCFGCHEHVHPGRLLHCNGCAKAYHNRAECLGGIQPPDRNLHNWTCPRHSCMECGNGGGGGNVVTFACTECLQSYCVDCLPAQYLDMSGGDGVDLPKLSQVYPGMEAEGQQVKRLLYYLKCPDCVHRDRVEAGLSDDFDEEEDEDESVTSD